MLRHNLPKHSNGIKQMNLSRFFIDRPIFSAVISIIIMILGGVFGGLLWGFSWFLGLLLTFCGFVGLGASVVWKLDWERNAERQLHRGEHEKVHAGQEADLERRQPDLAGEVRRDHAHRIAQELADDIGAAKGAHENHRGSDSGGSWAARCSDRHGCGCNTRNGRSRGNRHLQGRQRSDPRSGGGSRPHG